MSANNDDSESVDAFLQRIASRKDGRDEEDNRRKRNLEDEILQGRRERQARRAERAKSLSPVKRSQSYVSPPSSSPTAYQDSNLAHVSDPPVHTSPIKDSHTAGRSPYTQTIKPPPKEEAPPHFSSPQCKSFPPPNTNATALSRSGTLSWQQRPSKDSSSPRGRPFSGYTRPTESPAPRNADETLPRERPSSSLSVSSDNPGGFLQADRGARLPAYGTKTDDISVDGRRNPRPLPGIPREPDRDAATASGQRHIKEAPLFSAQPSSAPAAGSWSDLVPSVSNQSMLEESKSPFPTHTSQRFAQPADGQGRMSHGQRELQRARSTSPTKGLGGFVQSAMMKRSDSFNKRWSAQAAPGLSRGNSRIGHRGSHGQSASALSGQESPPRESNRSSQGPSSSPLAASRPTSRQGMSRAPHYTQPAASESLPPSSSNDTNSPPYNAEFTGSDSSHQIGPNEAGIRPMSLPQASGAPPSSPSKTMDPRRWSPTKASWLESALSKPESSKATPPKSQTPSWMVGLQKPKTSPNDTESTKDSTSGFPGKAPTGLMQSPPLGGHAQPPNAGGLPEVVDPTTTKNQRSPETARKEHKVATTDPAATFEKPLSPLNERPMTREKASESVREMGMVRKESPSPITSPGSKKQTHSPQPEPPTPPKTDFRANLRPRQVKSEEASSGEPEFKNVFAKLKRTETKHYVAPDELRNNIVRGKAALNLTGGPTKTPRVDEFKESILKKKDSMRAAAGASSKGAANANQSHGASQNSITPPEALAKRTLLNKRKDSGNQARPSTELESAAAISSPVSSAPSAVNVPSLSDDKRPTEKPQSAQATRPRDLHVPVYESKGKKSDILGKEDHPPKNREVGSIAVDRRSLTAFAGMGRPPEHPPSTDEGRTAVKTKDTLAGRLNPKLANLVFRPLHPENSQNSSSGENTNVQTVQTGGLAGDSGASSNRELTHMTKGRAKGPKRRLPKALGESHGADFPTVTSDANDEPQARPWTVGLERANRGFAAQNPMAPQIRVGPNITPNTDHNENSIGRSSVPSQKLATADQVSHEPAAVDSSSPEASEKSKPVVPAKSPMIRKISSPLLSQKSSPEFQRSSQSSATLERQTEKEERGRAGPGATQPSERIQSGTLAFTGLGLPVKAAARQVRASPTQLSEQKVDDRSWSTSKQPLSGLGLKLEPGKSQPPGSQLTPPPESTEIAAFDELETSSQAKGMKSSHVKAAEPLREVPGIANVITDFFGGIPRLTERTEVDVQVMISNRMSIDNKTKTLQTQISQLRADGKKETLSPKQGYILYEDCIYVCIHTFQTSTGSVSTEVYLWSGDSVSEAAVEDAQLFSRREARENNTRLELLKQGKEPAKFFQALGGIVVTRRSKAATRYMLCGRRYFGHVTFDEVDLDAASLCSGFPYIISSGLGKIYIWKGKGSSAEELGCARLIGMDLGLTAEVDGVDEVDEGAEPPDFFKCLGDSPLPQTWSQHWSLKSRYGSYDCRLFCVELVQSRGMTGFWTRRGSSPAKACKAVAREVHPFCQRDLELGGIFVLDAYLETFVYVGNEAASKSAEFVTALMFAQEYGILAASMEDRPWVPACKVTFFGAPREFTAAFRKWQHPQAAGLQGWQETRPQVVGLNEVLDVLRGEAGKT